MARGRHGGTILLLVVLAIGALAILAMAEDSEASWTGEPLPPWGGMWDIYQNTTYTDEIIRLDGDIHVNPGFTLSLDGCTLILNGSYDGDVDFYVWWDAYLYVNSTVSNTGTISANTTSYLWEMWVYGEAYFTDVVLSDLYYGLYLPSSGYYLSVEGCTINSYWTGIEVRSDAHIGNSTINTMLPDGRSGNIRLYGLYAYGAAVDLHNLDINIVMDMNETHSSSYYSGYYYSYGLYLSNSNVGMLAPDQGGEFSIDIDVDIHLHNDYVTTGYVRLYHRFYSYPIYLTSGTVCKAIKDIDITVDEDLLTGSYNATRGARIYVYNYQRYIYSGISSSGESPSEVSDLTLSFMPATVQTFGEIYGFYEYLYSTLIYISDSNGAQPDDVTVSFHDITVKDTKVEYVFRAPRYGNWEMTDCTFSNLETERVMELYYCEDDHRIADNTFTDITAINNGDNLFRIYRTKGSTVFDNNEFSFIEGYRLFEIYYNGAEVFFQNNLVTDNAQWDGVNVGWFRINNNQEKVYFNLNTFQDSYYGEGLVYANYIRDSVTMEENAITNNEFVDYMARGRDTYGNLVFLNNEITLNTGPLFEFDYMRSRMIMKENIIEDNVVGADYLIWTYHLYSDVEFTENEFTDNSADGALIYFQGPTYWSSISFIFDKNYLTGNTASSAINGGIVVVKGARYNLALRRNEFVMNTGNCINFYRPYTSNSWYTAYTFTVDNNIFTDNDGAATTWIDFRSYNIVVKRNVGTGNTGPLVYHTITNRYVYDYSDPRTAGEMTGPYTIEISGNNYTANAGGAIEIERAQWRDASTPFNNPSQVIRLSNNILRGNGEGWAIEVNDFGTFPVMVNNDFLGSKYGAYLSAIFPGIWDRVKLDFTDDVFDGGPNGMTAWGLVNVDADFTDCSFTNYEEALYARDCTINVYWSTIPEGSGRTEGRGYIYVWNNLEVLITWADVLGVDSGEPAVGATLALLGTNGRYYGALTTNNVGRIGPMLVQPWSSVEGRMDQWSPYTGTIISGGSTAHYVISITGEQVGIDALHLLLVDVDVPEVVITAPSMDAISNLVDMPAEGFLFETGSGIGSFIGYLDGGDGVEIDPQQNWVAIFEDLAQGEHTILFEAIDVATNKATATITFIIDAVAPDLDIVSPEDNSVTRDPNLVIQGSYQDDVSDVSEIKVRINGIAISSSTGVINENELLTEGVNTIIIDATDAAGNVQTVRRIVTLDTYPPTLYVYAPLNLLVTSEPILEVNGLSEAGTPILIEQVRASNGELIDSEEVTARADGTFKYMLDLEEGAQHIVFTAEDEAENVRTITRTVTLDTTPPGLTINSPSEGDFINTPTVVLVAQVIDDNPETVRVFVNGIPIEHTGLITLDVPLVEGLNTIVVMAIDPVDNGVTRTVNVIRDTIAPELVVEVPDFVLTNEKTFVVRGYVNDDAAVVKVAGVTVNVDEDNRFSVEMDLSTAQTPIEVTAEDMAENIARFDIDFIFDDQTPVISIPDPPGALTDALVITISGTVTDNEAIIDTVLVRGQVYPVIDGKFNVLVTVDTSGDGWNNFTISATDDAGNTGIYKINVQYEPEKVDDEIVVGPETNMWWYIGVLLIIAALVIIATVYIFAQRGEEE